MEEGNEPALDEALESWLSEWLNILLFEFEDPTDIIRNLHLLSCWLNLLISYI
jgi:hypothetical protein